MLKKITFDDKLSSLMIDSKYVITADNINEIKRVVNSLVDDVLDLQNIKIICKYISVTLPEILEDTNYKFEIGYLNDNNEKANLISLNSNNFNKFLVFENDQFKRPSSDIFTKADASKVILTETSALITEDVKFLSANVYYSLSGQNGTILSSTLYPLGYSPFKKLEDLIESKFFTVRNDEDLKIISTAIENGLFDQIKDRIIYQFNDTIDDKYVTNISAVLYKGENNIDITPSSLEFLKSNMIGSQISADYVLSNNDLSSTISIAQVSKDISSKYFLENFSSLASGSQQIGNYYTIFNSNEFKSIDDNFTSSVLISANQTYDNSRYILLSSNTSEHIVKELNKYPIELRVNFNKDTLSSNNDQILFTASLIYSDGTFDDITNDVNSRTLNDNINVVSIANNIISCNSINQSEEKYIIFSYKLDNNMTLYDIKKINIKFILTPSEILREYDISLSNLEFVHYSKLYEVSDGYTFSSPDILPSDLNKWKRIKPYFYDVQLCESTYVLTSYFDFGMGDFGTFASPNFDFSLAGTAYSPLSASYVGDLAKFNFIKDNDNQSYIVDKLYTESADPGIRYVGIILLLPKDILEEDENKIKEYYKLLS